MDLKNKLIKPDENSITRFEPFYQITPKELDEICKEYHAEQLRIAVVVGRSEQLKAVQKLKYFAYEVCPLHREDDLEEIVGSL